MKRLLRNFKSTAGFTLIELLVVIGILGILASALVATIDPFEQLNKAQDANVKNAAVEFLNANIRYFTTHNAMPWFAAPDGAACNGVTTTLGDPPANTGVALSALQPCITTLVDEGELKKGFLLFNGLTKIFITNPNPQTGGENDVIACFKPVSKSGQKDKATSYYQNGSPEPADTCKSALTTGGIDCYWCAQ